MKKGINVSLIILSILIAMLSSNYVMTKNKMDKIKVIIGIHGLSNMYAKEKLKNDWLLSIKDGIKNVDSTFCQYVNFDLVYWSDFFYVQPMHFDTTKCNDKYFDPTTYYPAGNGDLDELNLGGLRNMAYETRDKTVDKIGDGRVALVEYYRDKFDKEDKESNSSIPFLEELKMYFDKDQFVIDRNGNKTNTREALKDNLKCQILKYNDKEITVIAHSMGSIIAYEVLSELKDIKIENFLTIGSPLGLSYVQEKIKAPRDSANKILKVPESVKNWINYGEWYDPVTADLFISEEFEENNLGVKIIDDPVNNNYKYYNFNKDFCIRDLKPKKSRHKTYGYLRTPEISKVLLNFLK